MAPKQCSTFILLGNLPRCPAEGGSQSLDWGQDRKLCLPSRLSLSSRPSDRHRPLRSPSTLGTFRCASWFVYRDKTGGCPSLQAVLGAWQFFPSGEEGLAGVEAVGEGTACLASQSRVDCTHLALAVCRLRCLRITGQQNIVLLWKEGDSDTGYNLDGS